MAFPGRDDRLQVIAGAVGITCNQVAEDQRGLARKDGVDRIPVGAIDLSELKFFQNRACTAKGYDRRCRTLSAAPVRRVNISVNRTMASRGFSSGGTPCVGLIRKCGEAAARASRDRWRPPAATARGQHRRRDGRKSRHGRVRAEMVHAGAGIAPKLGLSPTTLLKAAGLITEPRVCEPSAAARCRPRPPQLSLTTNRRAYACDSRD